jgi:outer membrane protein assembly factor BamE (lipoprotein component of BamABCDE complex)
MRQKSLRCAGVALICFGLLAVGCSPTVQVHGYVPSEADLSRIRPGFDDAGSVEQTLGRPSSNGILRDSAWYYVQSTIQNYTYHAPEVIDRKVVAVSFNQQGVVTGIRRYGLQDGRVIDLETRTTGTGGREMGIVEQLFGNLLNLDAQQMNDAAGQ